MRTSMIAQFATLAFAFTVTAGPIHVRAENELEVAATSSAASDDAPVTTTSKSKTSKTKNSKVPVATADPDADTPTVTTTAGSDAPAETNITSPSGDAPAPTGVTSTTPSPTGGPSGGEAAAGFPASSGTSVLAAAQTIAAGGSFDGKMVSFDRGSACGGQAEGGSAAAVFVLEAGASLSNVIIGPNQSEGVHCYGACTLTNVWWSDVCEDAFTVKEQEAGGTTTINGGGAKGADDKVIQHNGAGTIKISDFLVQDFGKLYRACGNCKVSAERHVIMDGIDANNGDMLAGINSNFGDTATITNSKASGVKEVCTRFNGVASGNEPTEVGSGADGTSCIFGADVVVS